VRAYGRGRRYDKMGTNNVKLKKYPKTIRKLTENDFALIKEDITNQLENLSKYGKFYDDLVNEYLCLLSIREGLKEDIQKQGIRYKFTNGNGKEQEKANESVTSLIKVEQIMLKIVNDLEINQALLKPPTSDSSSSNLITGDDEDDLL
jgi:hypothetical protein